MAPLRRFKPPKGASVAENENNDRGKIARYLLLGSTGGIVFVAVVVLLAAKDSTEFMDASQSVFNALLPLFGTWVGTVTAYYFSKENFQAANQSVENMVRLTVDQRLAKLMVADHMMKRDQMVGVVLEAGKDDATITLELLRSKLGGAITRIPVFEADGRIKYIVHQSLLYKFIVDHTVVKKGGPGMDKLTLKDLAADAEVGAFIRALSFVPLDATVGKAKSEMERKAQCQDVLVTQTGKAEEPVKGWLSNVEIGKLATA